MFSSSKDPVGSMTFDQIENDIRCECGLEGVYRLAPISDAIIVVDIMSFSSCVSIAIEHDAFVLPYRYNDDTKHEYAAKMNAVAAKSRGSTGYSLSPVSLFNLPPSTRLVLPSPNGSNLSLATGATPTFAGCFRNAKAVAQSAQHFGKRIAIIPAGEKWKENGSLRVSIEDFLGAGAIIQYLTGSLSPEAQLAKTAFQFASDDLENILSNCISGRELIAMGYRCDIELIAAQNSTESVPILKDNIYCPFCKEM